MKLNRDFSGRTYIALARYVLVPALLVAVIFQPAAQAQPTSVQLREFPARGSLNFGPTSDVMVSGGDGYLQMWNWHEEKPVGPRMLVNSRYTQDPNYWPLSGQLRFSRDGRFMASCRDYTDREATQRTPMLAQVWDMRSGKSLVELPVELDRRFHESHCKALDFSPDGNLLAVAASGAKKRTNTVRFFDTRTWTEIRRTEFGPDARLLEGLRYSPSGQQLVVWADNRGLPSGVSYKEFKDNAQRIGIKSILFGDHRIEAVVIDADQGSILARRVLHWGPTPGTFQKWRDGFDASGERILSSVPHGSLETTEGSTYTNCAHYQPPTIPEGFHPTDFCRQHKAVQVWHWRTGQVDTLFEFSRYLRTPHHGTAPQAIWATVYDAEFTADGRYLVWAKEVEEQDDLLRTERSPVTPSRWILEIRDARNYSLLLSKELTTKELMLNRPLFISPDGRYLGWRIGINKRYSTAETKHLYELLPQ